MAKETKPSREAAETEALRRKVAAQDRQLATLTKTVRALRAIIDQMRQAYPDKRKPDKSESG